MLCSRSPRRYLAIVSVCFCNAIALSIKDDARAAKSATPVEVTNPADIAKAEGIQTPFTEPIDCTPVKGKTFCIGTFALPVNQRLVIEYVSAHCVILPGQEVTDMLVGTEVSGIQTSSEVSVLNPAGVRTPRLTEVPQNIVAVGEPVRLYSDAGSTGSVETDTTLALDQMGTLFPAPPTCAFVLSGQSVSVP